MLQFDIFSTQRRGKMNEKIRENIAVDGKSNYVIYEQPQRHVNTTHKKCEEFSCHLCDYKTIHKHFLNNHVKRIHQRIKRFHCGQCDYKSYDSGNLERHSKMVHLQIKSRFACELCDYKTFLAANLNWPVKAVHLQIKIYSCYFCDHIASSSQILRIHMNNKGN